MFVKMSLRDPLICFADLFCSNDSACLPYAYGSLPLPATCRPPAAPFTQVFSQSLPSHTLCSCPENLSTTNNLCNFWHSKFQQVSTYSFCSWDNIFTQKWNCSSLKTRFQRVEFWELSKFLVKKHKFSLRNILVHWWVGYFLNCNLPMTIQIQLLW